MRVLVVPNEGGGADAIRATLAARGHGVVVAKSPWARPGKRREIALAADVARCVLMKGIDVAYVEGSHRTSAVTAALTAAKVPYVLDVQGRVLDAVTNSSPALQTTALARPRLPITVELSRQAVRLSLRGARKAVTSSRDVADHLAQQTGVNVASVVSEPIVLDRLPLGARRDARAALELHEGPRFAALVTDLDQDLPYELLLHAHRAVAGVGLLVAGDGTGARNVAGMTMATRPSSPVMHIGPKTDGTRVTCVCAADIGLSIRLDRVDDEAKRYAALGRRQVLFDVPGARDLAALYPTHDTVFVAPPTVDGLADALRRALDTERTAGPLPFWAVDAARRALTKSRTETIVEQLEIMRVMLVTNGLDYGGAERIVEATAYALQDAGHETHVVATTRGGPIREALLARGVPVSVLRIASRFDLRVPAKLIEVARRFGPDVMHTHLAVADIAGAFAKPFVRVPLLTTVHNPGVELDPFKRTLWHAALRVFDRVSAVSEAVRRSLPKLKRPTTVSPISLVDPGDTLPTRTEARTTLGLESSRPLVLGVGRLAHIKGFDVLAQAVAQMQTRADVAVIGDGPERDHLRGLRLLGAHPDAGRLLAAADVVVCPSRSEGFPQVPLLAMAARRAVVATRVGGMPEVVEDGVTGTLVPPEDPAALAQALDAALADEAGTRALGEAGRRRLLERGLTRQATMDRTFDAYRELMVQTGSRGWI